jgi:hypothetical protein
MDPVKAWMKTDPLRRVIDRTGKSWKRNRGWRKVGIGTLIVILICVFLVVGTIVLLVWLVKGLSTGGARNRDLYLPGKFVNKDLYIPRIRR